MSYDDSGDSKQEVREVAAQIMELAGALEAQVKHTALLEERLETVLSQPEDEIREQAPPTSDLVPLAERLRQLAITVIQHNQHIAELTRRIEL